MERRRQRRRGTRRYEKGRGRRREKRKRKEERKEEEEIYGLLTFVAIVFNKLGPHTRHIARLWKCVFFSLMLPCYWDGAT